MNEYETLLKHFDDDGREDIRKMYKKRNEEQEEQDKTSKGKKEIKKELIRIKTETPKKCLEVLMVLQLKVEELEEAVEFNDEEAVPKLFEELKDIIANPEDKPNIFNCITELMAVCEESEIIKSVQAPSIKSKLTQAEILAMAIDPNNKKYIQCKKCMRCMTTRHYTGNHKGTKVCRQITHTKMATLKTNAFYTEEQSTDLIKLTTGITKDFNKISNDIEWGEQKQLLKKEEEDGD